MYRELRKLARNHLILTATRRLALRLQQNLPDFSESAVQAAPPIDALQDWLVKGWESLLVSGHTQDKLLSPLQEQGVWISLVKESPESQNLIKPYHTAKMMMQTWKLLKQWRLDIDEIDWSRNEEGNLYAHFAKKFQEKLKSHFFTQAELIDKLMQHLTSFIGYLSDHYPDKKMALVGFDDIPPQLNHFLEGLKEQGWEVTLFESSHEAKELTRSSFLDQTQELYQAALMAKAFVSNHQGTIGIVVPDLVRVRSLVNTLFNEVFSPETLLNPVEEASWQFNISAGLPLIEYPVIYALFQSFHLLKDPIALEDIALLLRSPFFKNAQTEHSGKMALLHRLKEQKKSNFSLLEIEKHSQHLIDYEKPLEGWLALLKDVLALRETLTHRQSIEASYQFLVVWMKALDWPGDRRLTSTEFQVVQRFYGLLSDWLKLETVLSALSRQEALDWLKTLCFDTTFQAESRDVNVQIMGLLEAAGQSFDKLIVTGLHSEALPSPVNPNPFIPLSLQRDLDMPHATAQRELHFAEKLIEAFKSAAPVVTFTHFEKSGDRAHQVSPLIEAIPLTPTEEILIQNANLEILSENRKMIAPPHMRPFPYQPEERVTGGTGLIQSFAQCPFQAFSRYRLHLRSPEIENEGINAKIRGILLHEILEKLWGKLKDFKTLLNTSQDALIDMIHEVMLGCQPKIEAFGIGALYWEVEQRRLKEVLLAWFELEKQRAPFSVLKTEHWASIELEGISMRCRLDRVDITEEGVPIILDYKTGQVNLKECFGERMDAPQLPLYCFADYPPNPKGVVFAQLGRDKLNFIGVTEGIGLLPGVGDVSTLKHADVQTWEALLDLWKQELSPLIQGIKQGHHEVSPKSPTSCTYCDLTSFCRVFEETPWN